MSDPTTIEAAGAAAADGRAAVCGLAPRRRRRCLPRSHHGRRRHPCRRRRGSGHPHGLSRGRRRTRDPPRQPYGVADGCSRSPAGASPPCCSSSPTSATRSNPLLSLTGLFVGFLVGLTGMGGGALMTPILILFFNFQPSVAIGTDIAYAGITKIFGSWRHYRHGSVDVPLGLLARGRKHPLRAARRDRHRLPGAGAQRHRRRRAVPLGGSGPHRGRRAARGARVVQHRGPP